MGQWNSSGRTTSVHSLGPPDYLGGRFRETELTVSSQIGIDFDLHAFGFRSIREMNALLSKLVFARETAYIQKIFVHGINQIFNINIIIYVKTLKYV